MPARLDRPRAPRAPRDPPDTQLDPAHHRRPRAALRVPAALAATAAALIALTWTASTASLDAMGDANEWLAAHNGPTERAVVTTLLLALVALSLVAAWHRASAPRRPVRLPGGRGTIAVDELAARLRDAAAAGRDVAAAEVRVENRHRRGVTVALTLDVTADARLEQAAAAATERVGAVLNSQIGVPLAQPLALRLRYRELRLRPRRADGEPQREQRDERDERDDRVGAA